ncbi:MAG: ClbS/DfsB family four-helix bundle protein [Simkania sp.]|nr:ClbS/DfsB family four-helix bundle protein [Simkania sp.]MCP5490849.1 ClbS/DfsB family four-helix bundle protein [Chlamydiales bacterium]
MKPSNLSMQMYQLSEEIESAYRKLDELLTQIPPSQIHDKRIMFGKLKISVVDLIAYQIGWSKLLLEWYQSGIEKKSIQMPGEGFTKWDYQGIAKHFFKTYCFENLSAQRKFLNELVQKIIVFVEYESQTENIEKVGIWDWCTLPSGKKWPLSKWVSINTKSPYHRAYRLIKSLPSLKKQ